MPVGIPSPTVARYTCTILTCDPTTSPPTIEAQLKGADARPISIVAVPGAFRWPEVGETWVVRQENGAWYLDGRASDSSDVVPISSLNPGQMRLDGTSILDANGNHVVASTNLGSTGQILQPDPVSGTPTWGGPALGAIIYNTVTNPALGFYAAGQSALHGYVSGAMQVVNSGGTRGWELKAPFTGVYRYGWTIRADTNRYAEVFGMFNGTTSSAFAYSIGVANATDPYTMQKSEVILTLSAGDLANLGYHASFSGTTFQGQNSGIQAEMYLQYMGPLWTTVF